MADSIIRDVTEVTTEKIGLVCKTKLELFYFLATECKQFYKFWFNIKLMAKEFCSILICQR